MTSTFIYIGIIAFIIYIYRDEKRTETKPAGTPGAVRVAKVVSVFPGGFTANLDCPGPLSKNIPVRISGIRMPPGKNPEVLWAGQIVGNQIAGRLEKAGLIELVNITRDEKSFRIKADVLCDGIDLAGLLNIPFVPTREREPKLLPERIMEPEPARRYLEYPGPRRRMRRRYGDHQDGNRGHYETY
ncbi:MAG: hypothetical protein GY765_19190 [bacterium]|nr:hypothetical protein [bacterium]